MFKRALLALACAGLMGVAVSCSVFGDKFTGNTTNANAEDENEITVWAWDENFNIIAVKEAAEVYSKTHPNITVNVVTTALNDIVQTLNTSLASADYGSLPDIVLLEDYKIQHFLAQYPSAFKNFGYSVNINDFMGYKADIVTRNGKIYGIPFDSGVAALFYRIDYIEQAGFTKADMQNITWEEYISIGRRVKSATGKYMLTLEPSDLAQLRIMLQSAGEWYVKSDGKTVNFYENKALRDAITIYKSMLDNEIAKPISDWNAYLENFQSGAVASVPIGCWIASSIMQAQDQYGKWGVAPIPRLGANENSVNASNNGGGSWYVINKKPNADLSADFLKETFASDEALINKLINDINLVSTLKKANSSPNYYEASGFFDGQEIFKDFSNWSQNIPPVNYGENTTELEALAGEALAKIISGADMDSSLLEAQHKADSLFTQ